jgi:ribosomal protein L6P/L9E
MYLSVSAGHDYTCTFCIPTLINVRVTKKNRRLLIYGPNKNLVMLFANQIYKLRPPSAYTGRGVRQKRIIVVRKKTKKQRKTKRGKSTQY